MSVAPLANAMACSSAAIYGVLGATSHKSSNPMFFTARAEEPTFPGWLGSVRMNRTLENSRVI
jgi:hypothetical protein